MVSIRGLRWCPDCGQVELDIIHTSATVVRAGDGRCRAHTEDWPHGPRTSAMSSLATAIRQSLRLTKQSCARETDASFRYINSIGAKNVGRPRASRRGRVRLRSGRRVGRSGTLAQNRSTILAVVLTERDRLISRLSDYARLAN